MASSSSLLDELPCLLDEGDKLTSRLLFHMNLLSPASALPSPAISQENDDSPPDQSEDPDIPNKNVFVLQRRIAGVNVDALAKFFARYSLAPQLNDTEKMDAALPIDPVARKAVEILVAKLHQLMKRIHHWQQALWDLLTQFLAHSSPSVTFATHRALTSLVLDALVKFVKMHLLWTSYSSIPGLLTLHTFLQQEKKLASGSAEDIALDNREDRFLREFVLCFGTNPLFKIQQTLQMHSAAPEIALNLSTLVLTCFESFMRCQNLQQLRDQGIFDLERCFNGQLQDPALSMFEDLIQRQRQAEWAICVALCIPSQLQRDVIGSAASGTGGVHLWDFAHLAAQDRLMMRIARDRMVNVHDLLYQQITYSLSQQQQPQNSAASVGMMMATAAGANSAPPLKKAMSALTKQTLRCCGATHALQREMVRWMLHNCSVLVAQNAALVAPLLPMLLAVGELARSEVEWLLCHAQAAQCNLPQHVKAKHWHRAQATYAFDAIGFSGLLSGLHRLRAQISTHSHFVHQYYREYLANGVADAIVYTIRQFESDPHANKISRKREEDPASPSHALSASQVMEMLESFAIKERYTLDTSSSSGVTWMREWQQISLFFLISDVQLPSELIALMQQAAAYTQYSQHLEKLVDFRLNVSASLCWFASQVEQAFAESLRAGEVDHVFALLTLVTDLLDSTRGTSHELEDAQEVDTILGNLRKIHERMQSAITRSWERSMRVVVQHEVLAAPQSASKSRDSTVRYQSSSNASTRDNSDSTHPALKLRSASFSSKPMIRGHRLPISPKMESKKQLHHKQHVSVGPLVQAQAMIDALGAAVAEHSRNHPHDSLHTIVQQHVQRSLRQLLREFVASTAHHDADTGATRANCKLRCAWTDACIELRSFLRCAQRLFPNAMELQRTLAAERVCTEALSPSQEYNFNAPTIVQIDSWSFADRVAWFYLQTLQLNCGTSPSWIASVRKQRFVAAAGHCNTEKAFDLVNKAALQQLLGTAGLRSVVMRISQNLVVQVHAVRVALALDSLQLAKLEALLSQPSSDNLSAATIKQLAHLESFVHHAIHIGNTLFLLQQLDDDQNQARKGTLREMLQEVERKDTSSKCPWQLLPVAFAASFHSSVWKRTSYVRILDAADTNAHMIALAVLLLLEVSDPSTRGRQDEGATCRNGIASLVQRLNAYGAHTALAMRQWDKTLPSPAMLSAVRLLSTASGVRCWLPHADMMMTVTP